MAAAAPTKPSYAFDDGKAQLIETFLGELRLTKSTKSGFPEPVKLLPYIREILFSLLCTTNTETGLLRYSRAYVSMGRKNAKTQLAAFIAVCKLFLDDEAGAEIYIAATTVDQADICFTAVRDLIQSNEDLAGVCKIIPSRRRIEYDGKVLRVVSSKGTGSHGFNPSLVILDELHVWHSKEHQELMDALTTGSATRRSPLVVMITTAGSEKQSICYREYEYAKEVLSGKKQDDRYYAKIYELPADMDWTDESNWHLSLPGLGEIVSVEFIRQEVHTALQRPSEQNKVRRLYFNQWVDAETAWLPDFRWRNCRCDDWPDLSAAVAYGGLDLGATRDLTAFSLVWPVEDRIYSRTWFWLPKADIEEREKRDGVPYRQWAKEGYLVLTEGNETDFLQVSKDIKEICQTTKVHCISYDRAMAADTAQRLRNDGHTMIAHGQGFLDMSPPSKRLEGLVYDGKLQHPGNPVMSWNVACVTITTDPAGNIKPVKPHRLYSSKRIDGVVSLVMALGAHIKNPKVINYYQRLADAKKST